MLIDFLLVCSCFSLVDLTCPSRQLHGKSLVEVNRNFLEKHNGNHTYLWFMDIFVGLESYSNLSLLACLTHGAAAAEMRYLLELDKKLQATKLIEGSPNNKAVNPEFCLNSFRWN
jgi:peptide alpha-N-acetyltransferase